MKKYIWEFARRGLVSCGFGPIVLAIVYLILRHTIDLQTLPVKEVCTGILSLFALAFIAGGMNFLYQIERLPLMLAILIHGGVLYLSYLGTYLLNGWLDKGWMPILIFTGIFLLGYLVIWAIIYAVNKKNTDKINQLLKDKQQVE
jgi:hypothetical protein